MRRSSSTTTSGVIVAGLVLAWTASAAEPGDEWVDLGKLAAWRGPAQGWSTVGDVKLDVKDPKRLAAAAGTGVICNGPGGGVPNLVSAAEFGDVQVRFDFFLPRGSNSGVKFQEVYEIQLLDSHGVKEPKGTDSGGIYPRSEEKPRYHHIDGGHPPLTNAALPAGQWQTLDATFLAPRFDAEGHKVADARISATLNGRKVQDDVAVATPTGSAHQRPEKPTGRLLLQADHGPVAFRNVRARRIEERR